MTYENKGYVLNLPLLMSLEENKRKVVLTLIEKIFNENTLSGSLSRTAHDIILNTLTTYSYLISKEEAQREEKIEKIIK